MAENESLGSFLNTNKRLAKEYLETRLEIFRLSAVRMASRSAGFFVWVIISLFLIFLIVLFTGVTVGFWLSELTGSFILGFGLVALALFLLFVILTVFRKKLFLDPLMQIILDRSSEEIHEED
jgi:type IV secretory pathway TrbL component